ncbi:MAG: FAD-dependent oxidoreductase [Clostridiales Family XIII bacterium]|jgi:uncharacterized FAD-dependent dehydrogenase|nr:FAD-dependent oxidoreductase [Clostridiales Family XIII bacterium]
MYYRIHEIKVRIGEDRSLIPQKILKKLRAGGGWRIGDFRVARSSVDARDKSDIRFVYAVDFAFDNADGTGLIEKAKRRGVRVEPAPDDRYVIPEVFVVCTEPPPEKREGRMDAHMAENEKTRNEHMSDAIIPAGKRPVIIGFGPCGIFAAYVLARAGLRPIAFERGKPVDERALDVAAYWQTGELNENSNVLFGEGGAGAFSDGKLTTGIGDVRKAFVLETLAGAGGGAGLPADARPHIGTDVLRGVVKKLREEIISLGGEIRFSTKFTAFDTDANNAICRVHCELSSGDTESIDTSAVILATGHSARDTYEALLCQGVSFTPKPFSVGVRIEHSQKLINDAMYGADFEKLYGMTASEAGLPPAEYKLSSKCLDGRGVYTFCMCPGGEVVAAASERGGVTSNGMSNNARSGEYANSAVLVDVRVDDFESAHPLAGVEFQRRWERAAYSIKDSLLPSETLGEFMGENSILAACLPDFAVRDIREALPAFGKRIEGFDMPSAKLYGPETRSSSPVRIPRGKTMQAAVAGLYPCGEGAGYAGGIMSAAIDGIKAAEQIIAVFKDAGNS